MHNTLIDYIRAGFAGIYLLTHEEIRAQRMLRDVTSSLGYRLYAWTITAGLIDTETGASLDQVDPIDAVDAIKELPERSLVVFQDFHSYLSPDSASPLLLRSIKEAIRSARASQKVLLFAGCQLALPPEIEKEIVVLDDPLPDIADLEILAANLAESADLTVAPDELRGIAESARGLSTQEAEDIMALSIVQTGSLDPSSIATQKATAVQKTGLLELLKTREQEADIGGLDGLKSWLSKRRHAFGPDAREFGLPIPKGVLILGIPGTGKSLVAKAAGNMLGWPVLKLDVGKLFAGIVGESEANLRLAIRTAEAMSPAVLVLDELCKAFAGTRSSGASDGGTTARVFGTFLNWLQEKTAPVFVVATCNDISQLPPELLRKGRYDDLFFVDLPDTTERETIWRIHLGKRHRDPEGLSMHDLVMRTQNFTGAEIEAVINEALFECFDASEEISDMALLRAIDATIPLAVTMAEQVRSLRDWAKRRARPASNPVADSTPTAPRTLLIYIVSRRHFGGVAMPFSLAVTGSQLGQGFRAACAHLRYIGLRRDRDAPECGARLAMAPPGQDQHLTSRLGTQSTESTRRGAIVVIASAAVDLVSRGCVGCRPAAARPAIGAALAAARVAAMSGIPFSFSSHFLLPATLKHLLGTEIHRVAASLGGKHRGFLQPFRAASSASPSGIGTSPTSKAYGVCSHSVKKGTITCGVFGGWPLCGREIPSWGQGEAEADREVAKDWLAPAAIGGAAVLGVV